LDFNALHRVGGAMEAVLAEMKAFIMIDHQKPDDYAAYTYSDTSFGSTCEMLYNFISFLIKRRHRQDNWNLHLYRDTN
jgi:phosphoesterase RecJ-like protein